MYCLLQSRDRGRDQLLWRCNIQFLLHDTNPTEGAGNITNEPALASASHLSSGSLCRGAGNAAGTTGTDIDGEAWLNPPSIGCDEFYEGSATGALTVSASANWTTVTVGFQVEFRGLIQGRASACAWDFGDGVVVSNRPFYASHSWSTPGTYSVVLRAYNATYPAGANASLTIQVVAQPVHYVRLDSTAPASPYNSWETAATTIQQAIDASLWQVRSCSSATVSTKPEAERFTAP